MRLQRDIRYGRDIQYGRLGRPRPATNGGFLLALVFVALFWAAVTAVILAVL